MGIIDQLLANSEVHAASFDKGDVPTPPRKKLVVVTCMDARINLYSLLGIAEGDAHLIRNAGGVITDDVIRSLSVSQHLLGTEEIMLIHHTECGMNLITDSDFKDILEEKAGIRPPWPIGTFSDPAENIRRSIERIKRDPFLLNTFSVRGFIYDVKKGHLTEVL